MSKKRFSHDSHLWPVLFFIGMCSFFGYLWYSSRLVAIEPFDFDGSVEDPVFEETLGSFVNARLEAGNSVEILQNGDSFFPAMIEDIRKAERSVNLESYIWKSGEVSDQFMEALIDRARNGVEVRVLVDGMGSLMFEDSDQVALKDAGVHLMKYGREHWYDVKADVNNRTHRKLLIVDGKVGYTGGAAIDDAWTGDGEDEEHWRDTQIRAEGPIVRQMQATFMANWLETSEEILTGEEFFPESEEAGVVLGNCFRSGPNDNPATSRLAYMLAIAAAKKSIRISQAYFIPDDLATEMLIRARERGVEVQVILPLLSDSKVGKAASRSRWGSLLDAGVELYQYKLAPYHCKVMVVDDALVTVGSINFDNRSFAINDEANVMLLDRQVAVRFVEDFKDDLSDSQVIEAAAFHERPVHVKAFEQLCSLFRSQL